MILLEGTEGRFFCLKTTINGGGSSVFGRPTDFGPPFWAEFSCLLVPSGHYDGHLGCYSTVKLSLADVLWYCVDKMAI